MGTCDYKIESAVWCSLTEQQDAVKEKINESNLKKFHESSKATSALSATLSKTSERECCKLLGILPSNVQQTGIPSACHIENIGSLLEQIEMDFRSQLERVVIPKAVEVLPSIYRAPGKSATVHLVDENHNKITSQQNSSASNSTKTAHGSGMGVGKDMIGDIAEEAKSKDSETVLETVKTTMTNKMTENSSSSTNKKTSNDYTNIRANLKSPTKTPRSVHSVNSKTSAVDRATPEFMNFRDKLKSPVPRK
ncbi:MAG: hypothetical protein SGILL_007749 [Bacillariaceae sp.]